MGFSREEIERAINFNPTGESLGIVDLGPVDGSPLTLVNYSSGLKLMHGLFSYDRRVYSSTNSRPVYAGRTTQPVWALVEKPEGRARGRRITALAYPEDVSALPEDIATRVLDRINDVKNLLDRINAVGS